MAEPLANIAMDGFTWVHSWLVARYGGSLTAIKYQQSWSKLRAYLVEIGVTDPAGITRDKIYQYLVWRKGVNRNTAYAELRFLSVVLHEAVLRSMIPANPCAKLGIKRLPPQKPKPEFTAEQMDEIAAAADMEVGKHAQFYRIAFLISRFHGCRISETRLPLSNVDFESGTITFLTKGSRELTVPLHGRVAPILMDLKQRGQAYTFAEPSNPKYMSIYFQKFLTRHGFRDMIPNASHHCLRVTVATRLARANIAESKAQRYLGHASTTVHRAYIKLRYRDLADCCDAL